MCKFLTMYVCSLPASCRVVNKNYTFSYYRYRTLKVAEHVDTVVCAYLKHRINQTYILTFHCNRTTQIPVKSCKHAPTNHNLNSLKSTIVISHVDILLILF